MPFVRLTGWQHGLRPKVPTDPLTALFIKETGMDGGDAEAAVYRLLKGKVVDISFGLGEDAAAESFLRDVTSFGLEAKLHQDEALSWFGSPPRPLFLKLSLAVLVGFVIWLWSFFEYGLDTTIFKVFSIVEGLVLICLAYSTSGGILDRGPQTEAQSASGGVLERRPQSETQKEWHRKLSHWWSFGLFAGIMLIGIIVMEPIYGAVLFLVILGGICCAFLIRVMNRG